MRIPIELDDSAGERPSGVVRYDGIEIRLGGWLELMRVLESTLRRGTADPGEPTIRVSPGANDLDDP